MASPTQMMRWHVEALEGLLARMENDDSVIRQRIAKRLEQAKDDLKEVKRLDKLKQTR